MLKLLLIRHGQSQGNVERRMEGWHSTPLTAWGRHQAYRLGQQLAAEAWQPTHIYCSPLQRATETLTQVLAGFEAAATPPADLPPAPIWCDDLKENNQGIFNGLTWAEARDRAPDLCQMLEANLDWHPIPQAETLEDGHQRAQRFVEHVLQHRNGDRLWVISHQWILQQIIARLMGCDRTWGISIDNAARFEFWLDRSRWHAPGPNRLNTELWQIKRFNESLPPHPLIPSHGQL